MRFNFGSGSGITAGPKSSGCSVFGILFGLVLVPLGFYLVYHGEVKLVDHGKVFERIEMMTPEAAAQGSGLVKTQGEATGEFLSVERWEGKALYWRTQVEEYQREEDADGDVEYDWNRVSGDEKWAAFSIGPVKVQPSGANPVGEDTVFTGVRNSSVRGFDPNLTDSKPVVGDQRLTVEVLAANKPVIVLGEVQNGTISGGSTFVVSTLDETATTQALKTEYKIAYWLVKVGAVVCLWLGAIAIFGPLLTLVGYIPLIGQRISGAFVFIALILAVVTVGLVTVFIKLFWVLVVVAAVAVGVLIWRGVKTPREPPARATGAPTAAPAAPIPVPGAAGPEALKCPQCGGEIKRADKFCTGCGAKLDEGRLAE